MNFSWFAPHTEDNLKEKRDSCHSPGIERTAWTAGRATRPVVNRDTVSISNHGNSASFSCDFMPRP